MSTFEGLTSNQIEQLYKLLKGQRGESGAWAHPANPRPAPTRRALLDRKLIEVNPEVGSAWRLTPAGEEITSRYHAERNPTESVSEMLDREEREEQRQLEHEMAEEARQDRLCQQLAPLVEKLTGNGLVAKELGEGFVHFDGYESRLSVDDLAMLLAAPAVEGLELPASRTDQNPSGSALGQLLGD